VRFVGRLGRNARQRAAGRHDLDTMRSTLEIVLAQARRYGRPVSLVRFRTERRDVERAYDAIVGSARAGEIAWTDSSGVCLAALEGNPETAAGTASRLTTRLHELGISVVHQYAVFPEHGLTLDGVIAALDESIATRRGFVVSDDPEPFDLAREA
jgi:hypothetical protein